MQELTLMSFGYLYGLPEEASTVLDMRGLPNPYWVEALRAGSGLDSAVRDYVFSTPEANAYFESCLDLIRQRAAFHRSYHSPLKQPLVIGIGCSGGRHRSVSMACRLDETLRAEGMELRLVHRDLGKRLEHSAGAVVVNREAGEPRFVIVQSVHGHHGFPKGRIEPGETERDTALRETLEETGLRVRLVPGFRGVELYPLPQKPDAFKQVILYLAEYENQPIRPQPGELLGAALMPFEQALSTLEFADDRRILEQANEFLTT